MKVKCEDCKSVFSKKYKEALAKSHPALVPYCNFVKGLGGAYKGGQYSRSTRRYLNGKGDCPYYKRKWWKVWKPRRYVLEIFLKMEK